MAWSRVAEFHGEGSDFEIMYTDLTVSNNRPTRSTTKKLTGAYSWRYDSRAGPMVLPLSGAVALRTSIHHYMQAGLDGDVNVFEVKEENTTTSAVEVRLMKDENQIRLYTDGVLRDTAVMTDSLVADDYWVQIALIVDTTIPFASVYTALPGIDPNYASKILSYLGAITADTWGHIRYGQRKQTDGYHNYAFYDDGYLDVSAGGEINTIPPGYQFLPSYTNAAGDHAEFTPLSGANYQMVDDGAIDDEDTTYNKSLTSAAGKRDSFGHGSISLPTNYEIVAAHSFAVARKLDAAQDAQIKNTFWDGATLAEGGGQDLGISYGYRRTRFLTQPDLTDWTESDFNIMQNGYKAGGSFS